MSPFSSGAGAADDRPTGEPARHARALANIDDDLIAEHRFSHVRLGAPVASFCARWDVEQIHDPAEITPDTDFLDDPDTAPNVDGAADHTLRLGNPLPARCG